MSKTQIIISLGKKRLIVAFAGAHECVFIRGSGVCIAPDFTYLMSYYVLGGNT